MSHDHSGRCGGRRGALTEPIVLAALTHQAAHGYDLRSAIVEMTDGAITPDVGGLYRTLRRLEEDGFVTSEWQQGESGPQRRDYRITAEGLDLARDWAQHLRERSALLAVVAGLIEGGSAAEAAAPGSAATSHASGAARGGAA